MGRAGSEQCFGQLFPWVAACLCCQFAPMGQLRGRQRGPSRGDASPHFPGDATGEKTLSWRAFLGFWSYGLEEGAFSVRCRPGSGLSPLRARAGAALVFFWADAHEGKGRAFLKKGAPKTFTLAALGLFTVSAALRRFPPLPARRPRRADSSYTGWGFAACPLRRGGRSSAAGPSSNSWPGRPGYSWWPWGR